MGVHMNQRIACSLVAVFLTAGFSRSGEASPVVLNGSFEDPLVTVNSFSNFNSGSNAITGWTVMGPAGSHVSIVSGTFLAPAFPAEDGAQWLDLTGNGSNQLEGVQQTLATTAGTSYALSFWVGNIIAPPVYGTSSTVGLDINGAFAGQFTNAAGGATQTWQLFSHTFVATGASTTIAFLNRDNGFDNSNGLDNISIAELPDTRSSPVPEPATVLLLGTGLASLAASNRRRRSH
jgi:Protein of unknown function (DUF642)/PEP-CTERM motif